VKRVTVQHTAEMLSITANRKGIT